jgi:phosphoglucomutase
MRPSARLCEQQTSDRLAARVGRALVKVPVGFAVRRGLLEGSPGSPARSAGASFLRRDGSVWTTDKDGIVMNLRGGDHRARRP